MHLAGSSFSSPHPSFTYCKLRTMLFLIFMEMQWLRIGSFLWVFKWKKERGKCQKRRSNMHSKCDDPENRKKWLCICVELVSHLGTWWMDRQRNWSFLFGCIHQVCFAPVREGFPAYLHFRTYSGLSEWRED